MSANSSFAIDKKRQIKMKEILDVIMKMKDAITIILVPDIIEIGAESAGQKWSKPLLLKCKKKNDLSIYFACWRVCIDRFPFQKVRSTRVRVCVGKCPFPFSRSLDPPLQMQQCNTTFCHIMFYLLERFRNFHKEWYSNLAEGLVETSGFVNFLRFLSWFASVV